MNELNDYVRGMLDKAETFKRASNDDDIQKYYAGKIVAYRNVIKQLQTEQLTIPVVVKSLPTKEEISIEAKNQSAYNRPSNKTGYNESVERGFIKGVNWLSKRLMK